MSAYRALFVLAALPLASALAQAPTPPPSAPLDSARLQAAADFVRATHRRLGLPTVAISVGDASGVRLATAFGDPTVDGHTPFLIGSVTKTFTAAAIARAAHAGRLDLDAPVEAILPAFALDDPFAPGSITARHLVHHRAGLSQWSGHDRRAQADGSTAHISPRRAPGGEAEYSSLNFIILGRMLEAALAAPFDSALESSLLAPLGLRETFVYSARTQDRPRAAGHQSYFGLNVSRREPLPPPALAPAGFVAASAHDLARYGGTLANRGELAGAPLLPPDLVAALLAPLDSTGPAMSWGYGRRDGIRYYEHAGNARTSSARVRIIPARGYSIAVLTNTNSGPFLSGTEDLLNGVHAILEGERAPNPWPRERLLKGAILVGTVWSLVGLSQRARDWDRAGRPTRIDGRFATTGPLAFDVGGAVFLLVGLPRVIGVPVHTMGEYFPDLAIALTVSAVAGATGGVLRAWTRSAP